MKKYHVTLSEEERTMLKKLIQSGKYKNTKLRRAQILLGSDENEGGKKMKDEEISKAYDVGLRTIERLRRRFVEDGFEIALNGKPRPVNSRIKIDGDAEAHLIATACSDAPAGYEKWTIKLLMQELKKKGYVLEISEEAVRQRLKKTKLNPGEKNISS
jgi:transposase